jgi:threonine synthase
LAGVIKPHRKGFFKKGDVLVLTATGHGFRDPDTAIRVSQRPISLPLKKEEILESLDLR